MSSNNRRGRPRGKGIQPLIDHIARIDRIAVARLNEIRGRTAHLNVMDDMVDRQLEQPIEPLPEPDVQQQYREYLANLPPITTPVLTDNWGNIVTEAVTSVDLPTVYAHIYDAIYRRRTFDVGGITNKEVFNTYIPDYGEAVVKYALDAMKRASIIGSYHQRDKVRGVGVIYWIPLKDLYAA